MHENNHQTLIASLHKRSDLHLARKAWHFTTVMLMLLIYIYAEERFAYLTLLLAVIVFIPLDFARQYLPRLNRFLVQLMRPFIRQSEVNNLAGTTFLLLGVSTIALIFPRRVIELSMMFLAVADPIASFFGIRYGRDKIWGAKSVQGFAAAFIACSLVAAFYFYWTNSLLDRWLLASLLAGLIGAVSELVAIGKIDDNFTLPVISSTLLFGFFHLFGVL